MSVRSSQVPYQPDYAGTVLLRELEQGADSALGYSHAGTAQVRRAVARWADAEPLAKSWTIEGQVGSITGSPTASFVLEISASVTAGGARTVVASMPLVAVGPFKIGIDSNQLSATANFLHVGARISGDAPHSINWSCQFAPDPSNPN